MSDKKPMTVEEIALSCVADMPNGKAWAFTPKEEAVKRIKQALRTFAAQEVEPLVEALRYVISESELEDAQDMAEKALAAHRAKYPVKL